MAPQFTYDNMGNPIGVFLPIEDWNEIKMYLPETKELPKWQKDILNERLSFVQDNPDDGMLLESYLVTLDAEEDD